MGSVISGAVRSKETLQSLETLFGKIKQNNVGLNIHRSKTTVNINERIDTGILASKIANQNAGEVVAIVSRDNNNYLKDYQTNTFKCKIKLDLAAIEYEMRKRIIENFRSIMTSAMKKAKDFFYCKI